MGKVRRRIMKLLKYVATFLVVFSSCSYADTAVGHVNVRYILGTAFLARTCEVGTDTECGGTYGVGYSYDWEAKVGDWICVNIVDDVPQIETTYRFRVMKTPNSDTHISFWGSDENPQYHTSSDIAFGGTTSYPGAYPSDSDLLSVCK